jgi:hypothetical protein
MKSTGILYTYSPLKLVASYEVLKEKEAAAMETASSTNNDDGSKGNNGKDRTGTFAVAAIQIQQ